MPKKLQNTPFTWAEAKDLGLTQYALQQLLDNGAIERLSRGIYRAKSQFENQVQLVRPNAFRHWPYFRHCQTAARRRSLAKDPSVREWANDRYKTGKSENHLLSAIAGVIKQKIKLQNSVI